MSSTDEAAVAGAKLRDIYKAHFEAFCSQPYAAMSEPAKAAVLDAARAAYSLLTDEHERRAAYYHYRNRGGVELTPLATAPALRPLRFLLEGDDDVTPFEGYTNEVTWNGWSVPFVTLDTALALFASLAMEPESPDDCRFRWKRTDDGRFEIENGWGDPEDHSVITGAWMQTTEGEKFLYEIHLGILFSEEEKAS